MSSRGRYRGKQRSHVTSVEVSSRSTALSTRRLNRHFCAIFSCSFAAGRKLRCDGQRPTCRNCFQRHNLCEYVNQPKRRGPGKAPRGRGSRKRARERLGSNGSPQGQAEDPNALQVSSPEHSQSNVFVNQFTIASSESYTAAPSTSEALMGPGHGASPLELSPSSMQESGSGPSRATETTAGDQPPAMGGIPLVDSASNMSVTDIVNSDNSGSGNSNSSGSIRNSSEDIPSMPELVHHQDESSEAQSSANTNTTNTNPDPP